MSFSSTTPMSVACAAARYPSLCRPARYVGWPLATVWCLLGAACLVPWGVRVFANDLVPQLYAANPLAFGGWLTLQPIDAQVARRWLTLGLVAAVGLSLASAVYGAWLQLEADRLICGRPRLRDDSDRWLSLTFSAWWSKLVFAVALVALLAFINWAGGKMGEGIGWTLVRGLSLAGALTLGAALWAIYTIQPAASAVDGGGTWGWLGNALAVCGGWFGRYGWRLAFSSLLRVFVELSCFAGCVVLLVGAYFRRMPMPVVGAVVLAAVVGWAEARHGLTAAPRELLRYREVGGGQGDDRLRVRATRWPRRWSPRADRPLESASLAVASEPNGARWQPQKIAGSVPRGLRSASDPASAS